MARNAQTDAGSDSGDMIQSPSQADNGGSVPDQPADHEPAAKDTDNITQTPVGMVARNVTSSADRGLEDESATDMETLSGTGNKKLIDGRDDRNIATVDVVVTDKEKQVTTITNTASDATEAKKLPISGQTVQKKPATVSQAETKPAESNVTESTSAKTKPVESSTIVARQAATEHAGTVHREDWLMKQDPHAYTLQLMAMREEAIILRFVKDHDLRDKAAYFNTYNNDIEWIAVVYGIYPTRKEAELAVKQLQAHIARVRPWIRSLQSVQDSIASYRAQHNRR